MADTTLTLSGTAEMLLALDPTIFSVINGTLTIKQTSFSSLTNETLSPSSELLVVVSNSASITTIQNLAAYIS